MKTKVICALASVVVAGIVMIACNSGRSSGNSDAVVKISADNPNNPYDYYGQMHNETILSLVKDGKIRIGNGLCSALFVQDVYAATLRKVHNFNHKI